MAAILLYVAIKYVHDHCIYRKANLLHVATFNVACRHDVPAQALLFDSKGEAEYNSNIYSRSHDIEQFDCIASLSFASCGSSVRPYELNSWNQYASRGTVIQISWMSYLGFYDLHWYNEPIKLATHHGCTSFIGIKSTRGICHAKHICTGTD